MNAQFLRAAAAHRGFSHRGFGLRLVAASLFTAIFASFQPIRGAEYPTTNFVVYAPSKALAKEIGLAAETFRHDLAMDWLGRKLPNWPDRCPIVAQVNPEIGAQGATSFFAGNGRAWGYKMEVFGSRERILDSVLPHEVTHTVFATHFGRRLPRWADEGACTTVEDVSERRKHDKWLVHFLRENRAIALHRLFAIREYPEDILPLYSQGYSLSRFLIEQRGKLAFVDFLGQGMERGDWLSAVERQYGYTSFVELQATWMAWVKEGSPVLAGRTYRLGDDNTRLASQTQPRTMNAAKGRLASSSGERASVEKLARTNGQADGDGWYSRQFDERRHQTREHATSHSSGKPGAPTVRAAATKIIRR